MLTQLPMLYGRAREVGMRDHFYSHKEQAITLKEITYIHLVFFTLTWFTERAHFKYGNLLCLF